MLINVIIQKTGSNTKLIGAKAQIIPGQQVHSY